MLSEKPSHGTSERGLASTLTSFKYESYFRRLRRILKRPGCPAQYVIRTSLISRSEHLTYMLLHFGPIATGWLHTKAAPQVQVAVDYLVFTGRKHEPKELSSFGCFNQYSPSGFIGARLARSYQLQLAVAVSVLEVFESLEG